jgi:hypothetical protein
VRRTSHPGYRHSSRPSEVELSGCAWRRAARSVRACRWCAPGALPARIPRTVRSSIETGRPNSAVASARASASALRAALSMVERFQPSRRPVATTSARARRTRRSISAFTAAACTLTRRATSRSERRSSAGSVSDRKRSRRGSTYSVRTSEIFLVLEWFAVGRLGAVVASASGLAWGGTLSPPRGSFSVSVGGLRDRDG